jgi:hypothetical protein
MLRQILKTLSKIFYSTRNWEEDYLSQSTDHADLERRIRKLDRREVTHGPFGTVQHNGYKYR